MATSPILHGIRLADNSTIENMTVEKLAVDPEIAKNEVDNSPIAPAASMDPIAENSSL